MVVQWLRICLPMQGTRVWSLVREDPTCPGATKPVSHNYRACTLEPVLHNKSSHRNEKPMRSNEDPTQPKKKKKFTSLPTPHSTSSFLLRKQENVNKDLPEAMLLLSNLGVMGVGQASDFQVWKGSANSALASLLGTYFGPRAVFLSFFFNIFIGV